MVVIRLGRRISYQEVAALILGRSISYIDSVISLDKRTLLTKQYDLIPFKRSLKGDHRSGVALTLHYWLGSVPAYRYNGLWERA